MTDDLTDYEYLRQNPSEFVEAVIGEEPTDYQSDFMDAPATRKAFVSGRQVGKSRTAAWLALHRAVTHPGSLVLVTADAMRQSSELFAQLRSEMTQAGITDDQWGVVRDTQTTVEFDHGSRIKVVPTGRNGNKIRGYTADYIIVDEAAFVDDAIFEDVIEPMTFVSTGSIVLCSTPYGTSGYFYKKATQWAHDDDGYSTWDPVSEAGIASYENPYADEETIDSYKSGKTQSQIAREIEGRFVEGGNNFFPLDLIRKSMSDSVSRDPDVPVYLGVDPSGGGDAESLMAFADANGNIFEFESHTGKTPDLRRRIQQHHRHYDFDTILVDRGGVGEGFVEELRERIGHRVVDDVYLTLQTKQDMYQTLKARMETNQVNEERLTSDDARTRIIHDADCKAQMENLGFSTTANGNIRIQPKDGEMNDDYPDSAAIVTWALPDNAGGPGSTGARGMTSMMTVGEATDTGNGMAYTIGGQSNDDDDLRRSTVRSSAPR